jgi:hypothetical protein
VILATAIDQLASFDEDATIFAKKPWSAFAEAVVSSPGERSATDLNQAGFDYFLEVQVAREVLEVLGNGLTEPGREGSIAPALGGARRLPRVGLRSIDKVEDGDGPYFGREVESEHLRRLEAG